MMNVLITRTALRQIETLSMGETSCSGLIMGHKRGPCFVVESIFPLPGILDFSLEKHIQLSRIFGPDLIGYFTAPGDAPPHQIMAPFAAGMLFGRVNKKTFETNFYQVEYNGKFELQKLNFFNEKPS